MKKVLVMGSTGAMGRYLVPELVKMGYDVTGVSLDDPCYEGAKHIKFLCIIAAPEGIKKLQEVHPDVEIYCSAVDEKLNEIGYIVPGLGDAGDRIFGTK